MKKSSLSVAIASLVGLSGAMLTSGGAYAQPGANTVEEVVVTGSRIRRADLEGFNPVSVIDRSMIDTQSQVSVGDLLQRMPYSAVCGRQYRRQQWWFGCGEFLAARAWVAAHAGAG
jgi:iron complex outermembrane recepter protein